MKKLCALIALASVAMAAAVEDGSRYRGAPGPHGNIEVDYELTSGSKAKWRVGEWDESTIQWGDWKTGGTEWTDKNGATGLKNAPETTGADGESYRVRNGRLSRKKVHPNGAVSWKRCTKQAAPPKQGIS